VPKKDTIVILLITVFIVTPAILALGAYFVTKNPSLRPLGITVERLSEAGQLENKSLIIAVIDIGTEAKGTASKQSYKQAIETTFDRLETKANVKFRSVPGSTQTTITYIVGESRIGPFPVERAAEGVLAAAQAERMIVAQRHSVAKEQERRASMTKSAFWQKIFD